MKIGCMLYYFLTVRAYVLKTGLFLALSLSIYLFVRSFVRSFFFSFRIKEIERIKSVGGIVYQSFLKEKKKTSTQSKQNELFLDIVHVNCLFVKRNSRENSQ